MVLVVPSLQPSAKPGPTKICHYGPFSCPFRKILFKYHTEIEQWFRCKKSVSMRRKGLMILNLTKKLNGSTLQSWQNSFTALLTPPVIYVITLFHFEQD